MSEQGKPVWGAGNVGDDWAKVRWEARAAQDAALREADAALGAAQQAAHVNRARSRELAADAVNHPPHYTQGGIECIDAIRSALGPAEFRGYLRGNALKYLWRYQHKGGVEDLRKARWYLDRLIAEMEGGDGA